jgi:hypothetical protein
MNPSGLTYRTPGDVRAIPNEQWGRWFTAGTNPLPLFSPDRHTQMCLRHVLKAHARRIEAG